MLGWFPDTTHIFFTTDLEGQIRHAVCDDSARRDEEIARAGSGVAFAIDRGTLTRERKGTVFFGSEICREESSRRVLALLANYAYAHMLMILRAPAPPSLSERQIEALSWAAEGKTDQEIATIMGVSNHTVDKYMRQTKDALGAANRTAAIVAAMRSGLIA